MGSDLTLIETSLTSKELTDKLSSLTIPDCTQARNAPNAVFYGEVRSGTFEVMPVRYGPMSPYPALQGEIQQGANRTVVYVKMDIQTHHKLARRIYFTTLFPMGAAGMLLSALALDGTAYQLQGYLFSGSFMVIALLAVVLTKSSLLSMKKKEIQVLASKINGKVTGA